MIISASRRTDIPAYFSEWFINRIKEGYVLVRNPMNPNRISRINLNKNDVECIVFWTKNPQPLLNRIDELNGYNFYFHFTLNPYGHLVEPNVPKKNQLIKTFIELSNKIGKEKVIWRYTPILFVENKIDINYHKEYFEKLLEKIGPYTNVLKIGLIEMYEKTKRNSKKHNLKIVVPSEEEFRELAIFMAEKVKKYEIKIECCIDNIDLSDLDISKGSCIDRTLISKICGYEIADKKDKNQRNDCKCIESADIGMYHSCPHKCVYCYANTSFEAVDRNFLLHDPNSTLLFGKLHGDEIITERKLKSLIINKTLF